MTLLPQGDVLRASAGTNGLPENYRSNAGARGRRTIAKRTTARAAMRTLSLSLLYVMSLGIFVAAYGFVPLG